MAEEIYKQQLIDRYQSPHHRGEMKAPTVEAAVANALCGDRLRVQLLVEDNQIRQAQWSGVGCAISLAAIDLLADRIVDMKLAEALALAPQDVFGLLGIALKPSREKCALLGWECIQQALRAQH